MFGVQPYLMFPGNCEEAINYYKDCMDGEILYSQTYGDSPMAAEGMNDKIMHCTLKIGDTQIMAADSMPDQPASVGSNIHLALGSDDIAKTESMFNKMSEGGKVTMPMEKTFWAERFGMLTDKFGINWMFNVDTPHTEEKSAAI
ncbi:MAG: VOC family protein [Blastocatellia bacterium]|nr:VOC family protein [Blastocatellia bacterium]MDQ3220998.1 VOC family protein [Acidobacteriota bacterium]